jgi:hypothetical protein
MYIDDGLVELETIAASSVASPPSGKVKLFFDSTNGNRLSQKDSSGDVKDLTSKKSISISPAVGTVLQMDMSFYNDIRIQMPAGNISLDILNESSADKFLVSITQDSIGSRLVTFFSTIRWNEGNIPVLSTAPNKRDTFLFIRTGINTFDGYITGKNI